MFFFLYVSSEQAYIMFASIECEVIVSRLFGLIKWDVTSVVFKGLRFYVYTLVSLRDQCFPYLLSLFMYLRLLGCFKCKSVLHSLVLNTK